MTPERWNRVKDLLSLALKQPSTDRGAVLDAACLDDPALRREVEELIDSHERMGGFLEVPLVPGGPDAWPDAAGVTELQQWTRYEVGARLGSGGMAVVYKAWDPRLHRAIAIKLIGGSDEVTVRRFLREAEAQARVDHDNIVKVYETGVVGTRHYIAMQYVDGPTLLDVRQETSVDQKVEVMRAIAEGLHAAHRHSLVHRDIKPGNVLVERGAEGWKPYLVDFGLAVDLGAPALTKTGVVVGTPRYMAPERVRGDAAVFDPRSDIYSLGATFYEFISGVPPFAGASGLQVLVDVMNGDVVSLRTVAPQVPRELDAIVSKCLERDPSHRYPSARALAADLQRYLDGDQVLARPSTAFMRVTKKARKHPRLTAAFAAMLLVTVAIGAWGAYGYFRAARQAEVAQRLGQEVRDIEWLFRAAQMSPLHSIQAEKHNVRARIERLGAMMDAVGSVAVGPGHDAIGRGLLALGETSQALQHFNAAWDSGYRSPDLAMALGLAHGEIFRVELARAQRIEDDRQRAARIAALEAEHRDPALVFLEQGRSGSIVPAAYVEALIASHHGDLSQAKSRADVAVREAPWLFEARLLPAHLAFNRAVALYLAGNVSEAFESAVRADGHYGEAQRVAASSVDAYVGRCAVAGLVLSMTQHGLATDPQPFNQRAEESCAQALTVDADHADAYRLFGEAVRFWADNKVMVRADPGDGYDRSAAFTRRAIELSGGRDVEARVSLADTFLSRAWWEERSGKDPRPAIAEAVATYEQALAVDPRNLSGVQNMGQAYLLRSRFERDAGLDPMDSQDRAVESFERGLRADPNLASGYRTLARIAVERADERARRGLESSMGLEQAIRFIEELPGDRALPDRAAALETIRARLLR